MLAIQRAQTTPRFLSLCRLVASPVYSPGMWMSIAHWLKPSKSIAIEQAQLPTQLEELTTKAEIKAHVKLYRHLIFIAGWMSRFPVEFGDLLTLVLLGASP